MNSTSINPKNLASLTFALSIVSTSPVFATVLISHIFMAIAVLIWSLRNAPNSLFQSIGFLGLLSLYLLFISDSFGLGERYIVEGSKIAILVLFVAAARSNIEATKTCLLYLSIVTSVFLLGYVIVSPDPFAYGGRLGILINSDIQNTMISANTIGLAINLALVTMIGKNYRALYVLIPVLLVLLFFTYSRGALICFSAVTIVYLMRTGKTFAALLILMFSVISLSGTFSELFYTLRFDDFTGSGRTDLYQFMYDQMASQPLSLLTGFGPGAIYFELSAGSALISAHSGYLEMIYTFGIMGLIATLAFIFKTINSFKTMPLDSLLYAVLILAYAISEDLLGSHALFAFGLMFAVILNDFTALNKRRRRTSMPELNLSPARNFGERW